MFAASHRSHLALLALGLLASSACDTSEGPLSELEEARQQFAEMSAEHGDDYDYTSIRYATAEGDNVVTEDDPTCVWSTTIEVRGGQVVEREVFISAQDPGVLCPPSFTESVGELGNDTRIHAAPPLSLDEWYLLCDSEVAQSESDLGGIPTADTPYVIGEDGMLQSCGWIGSDAGTIITGDPYFTLSHFKWVD